MTARIASEPGNPEIQNEDMAIARDDLLVVLDGATVRTDTGCHHGVVWYVQQLAQEFVARASDPCRALVDALASAIAAVARQHSECDLTHPGTPSAGIGAVRLSPDTVDWLVLGDVTVVLDTPPEPAVISDDRVSATALAERRAADLYPIGSADKAVSLLVMKRAELAARNRPNGYWISAADPAAANHALTGTAPRADVRRIAVLSDGAARVVAFGLLSWTDALDTLESEGPSALIRRVRDAERDDFLGLRWPRNKVSDDATAVIFPNTGGCNT